MSLTTDDLNQIRTIVRDEVRDEVSSQLMPINDKLDSLDGKIAALENDVKEIYEMIADLQRGQQSTNKFLKLSLEDKILKTYNELIITAKQAGVTLPRT